MTLFYCGVTRKTHSVLEFLQPQPAAASLKDPQSGNQYLCAEHQYVHCSNVNMAKIQNPRREKNFSIEHFVRDFCLSFNQHTHTPTSFLKWSWQTSGRECYWTNWDAWLLSSPLLADVLQWCSAFKEGQTHPCWHVEEVSTEVIQKKTLSTEIRSAVAVQCSSKWLTHEEINSAL